MYIISEDIGVDFMATGDELILQNGANLLRMYKGELALGRDIGISSEYLDRPQSKIESKLRKEILEQFSKHEPRISIKEIRFEKSNDKFKIVLGVEIIG